ncbi:MAG: carbon-phosphorus lyase complex subunit PhnI [Desulfobulbaceae bacterium]|nr:carbon-phosphorus lyase complex subunit PhnI [Desulfobulbaceae bacterium]
MSYVAIKGGAEAIRRSKRFFQEELASAAGISEDALQHGLRFACDRVMGEGALYSEKLAAEAVRRSGGDLLEAAFYLRAHRSTCQRVGEAPILDSSTARILRRISAAFKDVEGGQILGPSCDYVIRLLKTMRRSGAQNAWPDAAQPIFVPSALNFLREANRVIRLDNTEKSPFDITRFSPLPPYPRSAVMQTMARGETGSLLAFAYTSMRGYGDVHPTIGDLRLATAPLYFTHPFTGKQVQIGEMRLTACETAGSFQRDRRDGKVRLSVGYGFCFGYNETKAIAMSILDLAMSHATFSVGKHNLAANPEMIIHHVDGIASMGFTNHFKLPHYVTFQADLQVFRQAEQHDQAK